MSNDFYNILGVNKNSSQDEIKKAYRKKAMEYHPDRNKGDKSAEKKFKEIGEAYATLGDEKKKKQYDMFGKAGSNFGGGGNPYSGGSAGGGFEDIFSSFGGGGGNSKYSSGGIDLEDLFGGFNQGGNSQQYSSQRKTKVKQEPISLDFEKTYEVPIFDMILGCKIEVSGVYGTKAKLKIPAGTKPGTKMRVKGFGKKEGSREGNLIVKIEAKMPKNISDIDKSMLERIRDNVGY